MYIRVLVHTDAKHNRVEEVGENRFEIYVRVPAKENLANEKVRELLAGWYKVAKGNIRIVSGHHKPQKILSVMVNLLE